MVIELLHWSSLAAALVVSFVYFRDLGDITQALFGVKLSNMLFAIRHESWFVCLGLVFLTAAIVTYLVPETGHPLVSPVAIAAIALMLAMPLALLLPAVGVWLVSPPEYGWPAVHGWPSAIGMEAGPSLGGDMADHRECRTARPGPAKK